jgi:hypothetical protein
MIRSILNKNTVFLHAENFQIVELEFENVDVFGMRKTRGPGEKPSWQGRELTNNSTHMKYASPGYWTTAVRGERTTATHPCITWHHNSRDIEEHLLICNGKNITSS